MNLVRAEKSGIIYNFFIYSGIKMTGAEKYGAEKTILRLA